MLQPIKVTNIIALLDEWHQALARLVDAGEIATTTAHYYKYGLRHFLRWCEATGVQAVTPETFLAWKQALLDDGKNPTSFKGELSQVRAFFTWAVENKRLAYNPAAHVKGLYAGGSSKANSQETLTDAEVQQVLEQAKANPRDYAMLALMVYAGFWEVEVRLATLADLQTRDGQLGLFVAGNSHNQLDRVVVIDHPVVEEALRGWLAVRGQAPGPLFTTMAKNRRGGPLSHPMIWLLVKNYFKAAGVSGNKTTGSLRYTAMASRKSRADRRGMETGTNDITKRDVLNKQRMAAIGIEAVTVLKCKTCGREWPLSLDRHGRLTTGWWKCPNGCNSKTE